MIFKLHARLFYGLAAGILAGFLVPSTYGLLIRLVAGWDVGVTLYLALTFRVFASATASRIAERARRQDESAGFILLATSAGAAISLGAVVLLLGAKNEGGLQVARIGLAIYTIVASWTCLHALYTVHYAHEYYRPKSGEPDGPPRGGLNFQGDPKTPVYSDFAYHAFTIGMTAQTSDTGISTTRMRALALLHGVLSFLFNTVILALTINILAGLI